MDTCQAPQDCTMVGTRLFLSLGTHGVYPLNWAFQAIQAIENLSGQLKDQYNALQGAATEAALTTFDIGSFYPKPNVQFSLRDTLTGLGAVISIFAGFTPVLGAPLGAAGTILGAVSGLIGNAISAVVDTEVTEENFANITRTVYAELLTSLDHFGTSLLAGDYVGGYNILDVMKDGVWVDDSNLTDVTALQEQLKIEVLSRSINALWKTPSHNKMWVLFTDLQDDPDKTNCTKHTNGPQALKYCGDGGVYYAYNYVEDGNEEGHLSWPWGADTIGSLGIDSTVSDR